ncbi:MAG: hypothetical protein LBM25_01440 [Bacteroidales bacterium]|jgi:hypothetical protein|nr:hypothetical protein [Bacteroidales bacterium]
MNKLSRFELIIGGASVLLAIILNKLLSSVFSSLILVAGCLTMLTLFIINIKQHIFWEQKPLLTIFALFYKSIAYIATIFAIANYKGKDILSFILLILCIAYMIIASFFKKRDDEILTAYIYQIIESCIYFSFFPYS